jgi:hypothetical protein
MLQCGGGDRETAATPVARRLPPMCTQERSACPSRDGPARPVARPNYQAGDQLSPSPGVLVTCSTSPSLVKW